MRLINKNSKRGIVNLLSDFILSKINKNEKSIIQVHDCETFIVINGMTTSNEILDLNLIKEEFTTKFKTLLKDNGYESLNVIDIIKYNQEVNPINKGWINVNKHIFKEEEDPIFEPSIVSEFPYGYSLDCGRLMSYYSHYVINHMFNLLSVDEVSLYFTNEQDEEEDLKIKIISNSKVDKKTIKSLILDVFDFDLKNFKTRLDSYDLIDDILTPEGDKPYLQQDMLEHVILF